MSNARLTEVLHRIESHVASGELPVVVFDLDGTLFSTNARNFRILREFSEQSGNRWPALTDLVATVEKKDFGWDLAAALSTLGFTDADAIAALRVFWAERFFTDAYVVADEPLPGAVDFAWACHRAGAMVYYLTGRHVSDMGQGTVQSLTDAGFPFWRGRTTLHLKAAFEIPDREYKDGALSDIRSYGGPIVATFENEPENANLFLNAFPDALHFFLLTAHSPKPVTPHADLIRVSDFRVEGP